MKSAHLVHVSILLLLVLAGCANSQSPTASLMRGEIAADQYLTAVTKANEETRESEAFELNKEPTRAFNTKTKRFEFVPKDTQQFWNDETKRWEFTPVEEK